MSIKYSFTPFTVNAGKTFISGADAAGDFFGSTEDASGVNHNYLYSAKTGAVANLSGSLLNRATIYGLDAQGNPFGATSGYPYVGYFYANGALTKITPPVSPWQHPYSYVDGVDSAGEAFGWYLPGGGDYSTHEFVWSNGVAREISIPGFIGAGAGVTPDGVFYGRGAAPNGAAAVFLYDHGATTWVVEPNGDVTGVGGVDAAGDVFGTYIDADSVSHAFVEAQGTFRDISIPNATSFQFNGVTASGDAFGQYLAADNSQRGFVYHNGAVVTLDAPGAESTSVTGEDATGKVYGTFDKGGIASGFTAQLGFAPVLARAILTNGVWVLSGTAEAKANLAVYDGGVQIGVGRVGVNGAWSFRTSLDAGAAHVFSVAETGANGSVGPLSGQIYEGTAGVDVFAINGAPEFADSGSQIFGAGGGDVLQFSPDSAFSDAEFAAVHGVTRLALFGDDTIAIGAVARREGVTAISVGDYDSIAANPGALAIDASAVDNGADILLSGAATFTVSGLHGDLDASGATGRVSATLLGGGDDEYVTAGSAAMTVDASATTAGETLWVGGTSSANEVFKVGGNFNASNYFGALSVSAVGSTPHSLTGGNGADIVYASGGGDTIIGGGGGDSFYIGGHKAGDTFVYTSADDSLNASGAADKVYGFSTGLWQGTPTDKFDLSALGALKLQGALSANKPLAAHSVGWAFDSAANETAVFVNTTAGALDTSSSQLMAIDLMNAHFNVTAQNFILGTGTGGGTITPPSNSSSG